MATKKIKMSQLKKIIKEELTNVIKEQDWRTMSDMQKAESVLGRIVGQFDGDDGMTVAGQQLQKRKYAIVDHNGLKLYDLSSALVGAKQFITNLEQEDLDQLKAAGVRIF